jgi:threonine dehydrogenase-like Zn-dependent dehydrogenase
MSEALVQEFDATIRGGGVDVLVEVIGDRRSRFATVTVTDDDPGSLELSLKDAIAIRDLADRVIAALSPGGTVASVGYVCPYCGGKSRAPGTCGGSFLDQDHPAAVVMVPADTERGDTDGEQ